MHKLVFYFLLIGNCAIAQINQFAETWKNDKDLKGAITSFCIYDVKTQSVIAEHNSQTFVVPASTLKVLTTATGLSVLGNNYRYATKIAYTGSFNIETGVLNGNIVVIGSGDPTLQSEVFYKKDTLVNKWAKQIKDFGIKEIKGKIIGDASKWERVIPGNWIWSDISNYFGAAPCGLTYKDNKFKIIFKSTLSGEKTSIVKTIPENVFSKFKFNNKVIANGSEDEAFVYGDPFGYEKEISGKIPPKKDEFEVESVYPDPALLCAEELYNALIKMNVRCNENSYESNYAKNDSLTKPTIIYTHYSPSMEKIVNATNIMSNNLYAETILRTLGNGSSYNGCEAIKKHVVSKGISTNELYITDGSGLSRANNVTTNLQAQLLAKIYQEEAIYKDFYASLPIAGKNGSMRSIGKGTYIEEKMRAKTGYINRARGYCGYLTTSTGKEISFSVLFNNYNCSASQAKTKIEKFLIALGDL